MNRLIAFILLITISLPLFAQQSEYQVSDHELFIMPTAYTMPKATSYFTDYELFVINYAYALTPRTHLAVLSLFPITSDFVETFTFGMKQNFYSSEGVNAAFWGTITPKNSGYSVGMVYSFGKIEKSFHVGIGLMGDDKIGNAEMTFMAGTHLQVSKKLAWMIEYENFKSGIDEDFNGLITLGVRFRGETVSFDFGGMRPLEDSGDLLFIPFVKGTVWFN